jgi:uncharacterized repeat protein (TIGR01451 family)
MSVHLPAMLVHAAPLTGVIPAGNPVAITVRCNLNSGQPFAAGTYTATLTAALVGTGLSSSANGTMSVSCSAAGCSSLQVCGGGSGGGGGGGVTPPVVTPVVAFALQCPKLPSPVAVGDSLMLVFPVAATGNVAATSLTLVDVLGAGLEFVTAMVDYGELHLQETCVERCFDCSMCARLATPVPGMHLKCSALKSPVRAAAITPCTGPSLLILPR